MNNNEQVPEGDLFKWGEQHSRTTSELKFASPDDDLGWTCPQCELFGHLCPTCSAKQKNRTGRRVKYSSGYLKYPSLQK